MVTFTKMKEIQTTETPQANPAIAKIFNNFKQHIVGQDDLAQNLVIALISGGHVLLEGMPGLAKTLSAEILAKSVDSDFKRIQFTPDLLPSDLIGTEIFRAEKSSFEFSKGPLFANIILADEINRAPAKVQSALLEAMAEKQITSGKKTYHLPEIFLVIATQNPVEQEGTYTLPEAQLDRFLFHVKIDYPSREEERQILELANTKTYDQQKISAIITQKEILNIQEEVQNVYFDDKLKEYVVDLVMATRLPEKISDNLKKYIKYGVSPRATISLASAAKALAYINNETYVNPYHIQQVIYNVFRHRLGLNYNAYADNVSTDDIIKEILNLVAL